MANECIKLISEDEISRLFEDIRFKESMEKFINCEPNVKWFKVNPKQKLYTNFTTFDRFIKDHNKLKQDIEFDRTIQEYKSYILGEWEE